MPPKFWNVPNVISLYRLCAAPLIGVCLVVGSARWFIVLLTVSLQGAAVSLSPRPTAVFIFIGFYALLMLTGFLKFGQQPSLPTYGFKVASYLQGACLL